MQIEYWNPEQDGQLSEAALQKKLEKLGYPSESYTFPPGTDFPDHSHDVDKMTGIVSGQFRMTIDGETVILKGGDSVYVNRGVVHRAEVIGDEPIVMLDGTKTD